MKKIFNFYKRLSFLQGVAFAVGLTSAIGVAVTVGPLTTFTPGTTIQSSQVNANFTALKTAIESVTSGQTYMGNHDASTAVDPSGATLPGEYYIITTAGTINAATYAVGDWIMYDGTNYNKVPGSSTTVFGRSGAVVAAEGDYSLTQLSDVVVTSPSINQVLQFNGSNWSNSAISYTETDPSVMAFAKITLPTCSAGEFLQGNGSVLSCAGALALTANKLLITDGSGQVATSSVTNIEAGYLSGVTSAIQTQINAKESTISAGTISQYLRGDKTWQTFESSVLSSILTGFTSATNAAITSADSVLIALGKAQAQLNNKLDISGGSMTSGTLSISGAASLTVPNPISPSEAANKGYVDSAQKWNTSGADIYFSTGNVGIGISNPTSELMVAGNAEISGKVIFANGTAALPSIANGGGQNNGMFFPTTGELGLTTTGVERVRISPIGNIGVGTTTPMAILDISSTSNNSAIVVPRASTATRPTGVDGMIRYNTTTLLMEFFQNGSWVNFTTISDGRLKTNLSPVHRGLATVNKLQPVFFDWDQNSERAKSFGTKHQIGFIAQQVEKVLPEVVNIGNDSFRSIEYGKMVAVVVSAVQELSKKFDSMESRNNSKDREMEIIKEENKILKSYLCTRDPMAPFCE